MARSSTLFLKAVIYLMGLAVLGLCIILIGNAFFNPNAGGYFPILIGMCVAAMPFFYALHQGLRILRFIDESTAFAQHSVDALRIITYCAFTISTIYAAGMPYIVWVAEKDDAPGVVLLGLIFIGAPLVVGVFSAVLHKLLEQALVIKSENDLTV